MDSALNPPPPASALTHYLSQTSTERHLNLLHHITSSNSQTTFARESTALSTFRKATADGWSSDVTILHSQFKASVPLTDYKDYQPFIERLMVPNCPASSVQDLLSPGLPEFLAQTSGTSGSGPKIFPKYDHPIYHGPKYARSDKLPSCGLYSMRKAGKVLDIHSGDGGILKRLPITSISAGAMRLHHRIGIEQELEIANSKPNLSVSPFAVYFLPSEVSILFMHMLFAIANPSLGVLMSSFSTVMYDAICLMEENWDSLIDSIERGVIPEFIEIGEYQEVLRAHLKPSPVRAGDLRRVNKGSSGWLKEIWPNLCVIRTNASGVYALAIPKIRHHAGPHVTIMTGYWGSTECSIGAAYDASDLNLYRMASHVFFEFLDVSEPETPEHLSQCWELQVGKHYELIVTTHEGLWRYRQGDVVEVAGFAPDDGQPLIRFIERRGIKFQIAGEFISENYLTGAILSLTDSLGSSLAFTVYLDGRDSPRCYGFLIELHGEIGPNPKNAVQMLHAYLLQDLRYKQWVERGCIGKPRIRIVAQGTFQAYRTWKATSMGMPISQMKVGVVIGDQPSIDWLGERVILEVET